MRSKSRSSLTYGLSGRLLVATLIFLVVAEILLFVPSVANMRVSWIKDRLSTAAVVGALVDGIEAPLLPTVQNSALAATGAKLIVLRRDGTSRLIMSIDVPPNVDAHYDLEDVSELEAIWDAFAVLLTGGNRVSRYVDVAGSDGSHVEIVMKETELHKAMLAYALEVFLLTMAVLAIGGVLMFFTFNRVLIKPIRRLTDSMANFAEKPEDASRIYKSDMGGDELSTAGQHLSDMQLTLHRTLKQQSHLAELGLAVSKINHDMRNILSSAQLISDRLGEVNDPVVRNFASKLWRSLDRAVAYSSDVLSFGQASEHLPNRRMIDLNELVADVRELLPLNDNDAIRFDVEIPDGLLIDADADQLFRVIHNLSKNAVFALSQKSWSSTEPKRLTIKAGRVGNVVSILIDDNGPGMPLKAKQNLFTAFKGSARSGGTGLGLVIARELILAHGGTIALVEKSSAGTLFRIDIEDSH